MLFKKENDNVINNVVSLPVAAISPNPSQPRVFFDEYALTRLAVSIRQNGVMQPLSVRKEGGGYQLVAGERRLRAAKMVNLEYVPCIIINADDSESAVLAILENIQRADLNYLEEAAALKKLIDHYGMTQDETAQRVGKSRPAVTNALRLLSLCPDVLEQVRSGKLSAGHARAVLSLKNEKQQKELLRGYLGSSPLTLNKRTALHTARSSKRYKEGNEMHFVLLPERLARCALHLRHSIE